MESVNVGRPLQFSRMGVPIGRALLGALFVVSGLLKIGRFTGVAAALGQTGLPLPEVLAAAVIVFEVLAGLALAFGWRTRLSAALLAVFVVLATLLFHRFWGADAAAYGNQLNHFLKNMALTGALTMLACAECDGQGAPFAQRA